MNCLCVVVAINSSISTTCCCFLQNRHCRSRALIQNELDGSTQLTDSLQSGDCHQPPPPLAIVTATAFRHKTLQRVQHLCVVGNATANVYGALSGGSCVMVRARPSASGVLAGGGRRRGGGSGSGSGSGSSRGIVRQTELQGPSARRPCASPQPSRQQPPLERVGRIRPKPPAQPAVVHLQKQRRPRAVSCHVVAEPMVLPQAHVLDQILVRQRGVAAHHEHIFVVVAHRRLREVARADHHQRIVQNGSISSSFRCTNLTWSFRPDSVSGSLRRRRGARAAAPPPPRGCTGGAAAPRGPARPSTTAPTTAPARPPPAPAQTARSLRTPPQNIPSGVRPAAAQCTGAVRRRRHGG